jgi:hypothetical protein
MPRRLHAQLHLSAEHSSFTLRLRVVLQRTAVPLECWHRTVSWHIHTAATTICVCCHCMLAAQSLVRQGLGRSSYKQQQTKQQHKQPAKQPQLPAAAHQQGMAAAALAGAQGALLVVPATSAAQEVCLRAVG